MVVHLFSGNSSYSVATPALWRAFVQGERVSCYLSLQIQSLHVFSGIIVIYAMITVNIGIIVIM